MKRAPQLHPLPRSPFGFSGMTPLERQVMDLWDAGHSVKQILAAIGTPDNRPRTYVDRIISTYDGKAEYREFRCETRGSSDRLLAAIARHHPERLAA